MIAVIAEKPELARAIASAISKRDNKPTENKQGYIKVGNYCVAWAYGHLLKLKELENYNEKYKKWTLEDLPIYFDNWEYEIDKGKNNFKASQLNVIKKLLQESTECIHGGDPDDEGQALIDEILQFYNYTKPVKRVLINDNNTEYVIRALNKLESNKKYEPLGQSAYARAVCDNIFGKNLTRFFTLKSGGSLVKVGRVQTPTLQLVINRDRAIENHVKSYYYTIELTGSKDGNTYTLLYSPKEKITDIKVANQLIDSIKDLKTVPIVVTKKITTTQPPLAYNLVELQVDSNSKYGYSPQKVLDITQKLRENYKAITYNRSDCRYLGEENFKDAPKIINLLKSKIDFNTNAVDETIKGAVFDDTKITAHHAIIPTVSNFNINQLTSEELNVYNLIAKRYLEQFCKPSKHEVTNVVSNIKGMEFTGSSSKLIENGYLEVISKPEEKIGAFDKLTTKDTSLNLDNLNTKENETKPQPRYNEGTLIKDMVSISKYVEDEHIKKLLKEKDKEKKDENGSIGTPATRATIIDNLIKSGYLEKKGKSLISTPIAREFCDKLPKQAKSIDNTAIWYQIQEDIKDGKVSHSELELKVLSDIKDIMNSIDNFNLENKNKKDKNFSSGSSNKVLSPYLDPITNEPLYQLPTKKDPKKLWYTRATYDKNNPVGYMLSFDNNSLYELNSKKSYPIVLNPDSPTKPSKSATKSTKSTSKATKSKKK